MEVIGILIGVAIFLFYLVAPIIALIRANRAARAVRKNDARLQELTAHAHSLDRAIAELKELFAKLPILEYEVRRLKESTAFKVSEPAVAPPSPEILAPLAKASVEAPRTHPVTQLGENIPPPPIASPIVQPVAADGFAQLEKGLRPEPVQPQPHQPSSPYPAASVPLSEASSRMTMSQATRPARAGQLRTSFSFEEALGTNWLNKLGIVILVIGVALFLGYQLQNVGPLGKVFVGTLIGVSMLGSGVFFERRERWRILARAGIGGGWALLFFTTYAMNHVSAARVLASEPADFVLLLLVAAAMVAHTLRYQSQVVTGLAFLLAFSTINISHGGASGLWAAVILSAGLALIAVRRNWYELEIFGLLAAYLNHYYWLRPIIEPMGAHHHAFPELTASTTLLIAYWLIFRASYIVRRIGEKYQENVSTVAALLNTFLFHGVIAYQSARPELAFPFLLGVGSTEMVLGQLPITRRRRTAFLMLSTIGAVLLVAAFSYRFSGGKLSVVWLLEAEALLLAGVFTREVLFRRLGMLTAVLVAVHMVFVDAVHLSDARALRGVDFSDPRVALIFAVASLVLYANSHWLLRRNQESTAAPWEEWSVQALSYLAGLMVLLAAWAVLTEKWLAVGWTALALGAAAVGSRRKIKELTIQASALTLVGVIRVLVVNFSDPYSPLHYEWLSRRLMTVLLVAALVYLSAQWSGAPGWAHSAKVSQIYIWVGSTLVLLLIWYQMRPVSVTIGWMLFGLVLFELGFARRSFSLRLQGYLALASSFLRMFFVNLNAAGFPGQISPRVYTTLPLAAGFFYVFWRLENSSEGFLEKDRKIKAPDTLSFSAMLTVAALMRFELDADYVVAAWAALVSILLAVAWRFGKRVFLYQGILLGFALFFRCIMHNLYVRSYFPAPFWHGRMLTVGMTVALLFLAWPFAVRLKLKKKEGTRESGIWPVRVLSDLLRRPDQVFFFIPFAMLTALLGVEMRSGLVTLAWGVEAVAVFLFALWVGERSFRLSGMSLLLVCVAKIVLLDVWALQPRDRYLTFIVLGIALTGVSFLYTRYRDTLRQYL